MSYKTAGAVREVNRQNADIPQPLNREDLLLYGITLVVVATGLWAVWFTLASPEVAFLFMCGVLAGFGVSMGLRNAGKPLLYNLLSVVAALLGILYLRYSGYELIGSALPFWAQLTDPAVGAASSLGLLLVLSCFFLGNRQALIFTTVPVLAVYGLLASQQDPRIIIGFLCYLIAALFLLVYEHTIELRDESGLRLPKNELDALPRTQLVVTSGIFLSVLVLALSFTAFLMMLLSRDRVSPALESLGQLLTGTKQHQERRSFAPVTQGGQQTEVPVGTGPLTPATGTIMYVRAKTAEMWRQRAYDVYTGRGWSIGSGQLATQHVLNEGAASLVKPAHRKSQRVLRQTFRLAVPFWQGIPAAADPLSIEFDKETSPIQVTVDRFGCLVNADRELAAGEIYTVDSSIKRVTDPPTGERLSEAERAVYLQLPLKASKLRDLVDEIVPRNADPLRKVVLLMGYLHPPKYTYTLQAPAVPEGEDAASFFLFDSKKGYCDLFATAFAMMCRATGLPSRFVLGYGEGKMTPSGEYQVDAANAHAWVEVFIPDRGWMTFDPTPPGQEEAALEEARNPVVPAWRRFVQRVRISLVFLALAVLVTAALVKVLWFDPWWQRRRWERRLWSSIEGRIMVMYGRMCRLLAGRGMPRQPSQTPLEYLATIESSKQKVGLALAPAEELTRLFVRARYGRDSVDAEMASTAHAAYMRFKQLLGKKPIDRSDS